MRLRIAIDDDVEAELPLYADRAKRRGQSDVEPGLYRARGEREVPTQLEAETSNLECRANPIDRPFCFRRNIREPRVESAHREQEPRVVAVLAVNDEAAGDIDRRDLRVAESRRNPYFFCWRSQNSGCPPSASRRWMYLPCWGQKLEAKLSDENIRANDHALSGR